MPIYTENSYPILIEFITGANPIGQADNGFGQLIDVYIALQVHAVEMAGLSWSVSAADTKGKTYTGALAPYQDALINLNPPRRFETYPKTVSYGYVRA